MGFVVQCFGPSDKVAPPHVSGYLIPILAIDLKVNTHLGYAVDGLAFGGNSAVGVRIKEFNSAASFTRCIAPMLSERPHPRL